MGSESRLTIVLVPSLGAIRKAAEDAVRRELLPEEVTRLHDDATSVALPTLRHRQRSRTVGHRNTEAQITQDAADLRGAVERDWAAYGPDMVDGTESRRDMAGILEAIHEENVASGRYACPGGRPRSSTAAVDDRRGRRRPRGPLGARARAGRRGREVRVTPAVDVVDLIDLPLDSAEVAAFLGEEPVDRAVVEDATYLEARMRGIVVGAKYHHDTVDHVQLVGADSRFRLAYAGELPGGLVFGMRWEDCVSVLGPPVAGGDGGEDRFVGWQAPWVAFEVRGRSLHCFLGGAGEALDRVDVYRAGRFWT